MNPVYKLNKALSKVTYGFTAQVMDSNEEVQDAWKLLKQGLKEDDPKKIAEGQIRIKTEVNKTLMEKLYD